MTEELLRELEDQVARGQTVRFGVVLDLIAWVRDLERRREDALIHYRIGRETTWGDLYVDWRYVCERMAGALQDDDPSPTATDERSATA